VSVGSHGQIGNEDVASLQRLHELSTRLIKASDPDGLYDEILDMATAVMRSQFASMQLFDRSRSAAGELRLLGFRGFNPAAAESWQWISPHHRTTCGMALATRRRVIVDDVMTCELMRDAPDLAVYLDTGIRAMQTTPLVSRSGELLGMISTHWSAPHAPTQRELALFDVLAEQAGFLLERHLAEAALHELQTRDAFRMKLVDHVRPLTDAHDIQRCVARLLSEHLGLERVMYMEVRETGEVAVTEYARSRESLSVLCSEHELAAAAIAAFRASETFVAANIETDGRLNEVDKRALRERGIRACVGVPLVRGGRWVGSVCVHGPDEHVWRREEIALIEDTAERMWANVEGVRAAAALREVARNKDLFLAMLAHELRNPLAPLRTGIELVKARRHDPESIASVATIMDRQFEHVVRLVDDLLDASRITQGVITLQRAPAALEDIVNTAVEANRARVDAAQIELCVQLPAHACTVDVDGTRLVQVVSNLLHNAVKFTPLGGRIDLLAEARDGELSLGVCDSGAGIPAEFLPHVFELFAQGTSTTNASSGGLGIGLALARHIVELHGGSIEARSAGLGTGSEFWIRMPVVASDARVPSEEPEPSQVRTARSVLIIDDNADAADMLAMFVESCGCVAHVAYDGATGLARARELRPDVVLLDIGMSGLDGYETCRQIRLHANDHSPLVIAVSGWGKAEDKQRASDAGFTAHITKPVAGPELRRYLELPTPRHPAPHHPAPHRG
jgi:signal transduction histidine kinase/ActR/RegA family two-component response regulator